MTAATHHRSKTLATWIALVGGLLGLHRFYLHGLRDPVGWLYPLPTLLGVWGVQRMLELGHDDRVAWVMMPLLGLMLVVATGHAIAYGLTPDETWRARYNPGSPVDDTRFGPVIGVVVAVMLGAAALTSTIAYGGQRLFEWQLERERAEQRG